jgi:hypothetical protein
LNDGTPGYLPSYVLSDIVTAIPATTHLSFALRNSGGVVIDGVETTKTVVGGSGFFAVNTSTPAIAGAGLDIVYAPQINETATAQVVNALTKALDDASSTTTPTDSDVPQTLEKTDPNKPSGDLSKTVGGTEDSFGGDEGGGKEDKKGDKKDEKDKKDDKKSDDGTSEKKDDKPAQKKVAQCS